ncbi:hypothetical protein PPERSA_00379 [Pseudocohnilembus persalinus]|uniref:Dynein light chain n=1 Tax=Pseudocohnilembus persalinus TaxID=266149 RepID=A0A0V0QY94_PSEPJ|nr:hypothetical protein PPERSA_00379 [Pseudocohnilembus persalinus]|eukprot:KRX07222.1 hypothetical protein PPERSA_00379 [Pseudocohnilembus persalinus]
MAQVNTFENPVIKATDMDQKLLKEVIEHAKDALRQLGGKKESGSCPEREVANWIKEKLDKDHPYGWNCVVGRSFGSHIVHRTKNYVFFQVAELSILVWKA